MTVPPQSPPGRHWSRPRFAESEAPGDVHPHFGLLYESRAEQFAVAIPFVEEGLERGERCVYAAAENAEREIRDALRAAGVDVEAAFDAGALTIQDAEELYTEDGEFSIEATLDRLDELAAEATGEGGFAGLRVTAEMAWLHDGGHDLETFLDYEREVNHVYPELDLVGLCQYDRDRASGAALDRIVRTHPVLTGHEAVAANPYYLAPESDPAEPPARQPEQQLDALDALHRRERGLTVVTEATPRLMGADWEDIPQIAVASLRDAVQLPVAGLWLYDREADALQLEAATGPATVDAGSAVAACSELAWRAFRTDEPRAYDDLDDLDDPDGGDDGDRRAGDRGGDGAAPRSAVFLPVGGYGVLCAAAPTPGAVDATAARVGEAVVANTAAALERADHERQRDAHRDHVTELSAANRLLRETIRAVASADTRADVEAAVCEQLAAVEDAGFAWIGARDDGELTPRAWAGDDRGYLGDFPVSEQGAEPAIRAATSGETVVVPSIVDEVEAGRWRTAMLSREFRSAMGLPLAYNDVSYGVVTVYATRSAAFDERLRPVLDDLAPVVAQAIHLAEQTRAIHEQAVQELEFEVTASNFPFLSLARAADCTLAVEGSLGVADGRTIAFVTVDGVAPDRIVEAVDGAVAVADVTAIGETDGGHRVLLALEDQFVGPALADHGATLGTVRADPTSAEVVVTAPSTVAAQSIVGTMEAAYPETELVARRHRDRSPAAAVDHQSRLLERLTERQLDVLEAAYHADYFETPRASTGEDVAEMLDIAPQTFSQHLRRIQRKLFEALLADR